MPASRSARLAWFKPIIGVCTLAGLASAAWWLSAGGKGQPEDPARVLIVGPTPQLAEFLQDKGFDALHLSWGAAIGEGKAFDSTLDGLAAILEYADQSGIGYVALSMAHGERHDFAGLGYGADAANQPPPGTTFAIASVGDLGQHISYGGVVPAVVHEHPVDERVGLLLGLFNQPKLAKARTRNASNDLMIRFGSARTLADVAAYEQAQDAMRRQITGWTSLAAKDRAEPKPTELAAPYEPLRGWPLANGAVLLGSGRDAWRSEDGLSTRWADGPLPTTFSVVALGHGLGERSPCPSLPDTLVLDGGFTVASAGDALLIPRTAHVADLWVLTGDGCGFEKRAEIRRLDGGALGEPRASGRTAASQAGRVTWADAQMRAYRHASFAGVGMRPDALRWADDERVVIPAALNFADAITDPLTLEPLPSDREAIVWVQLPAPEQHTSVELAVIPIDALLPGSSDPLALSVRDVFPIAAEPGSLVAVALLDGPDGPSLVRAELASAGPAWQDGLAPAYDLTLAAQAGRVALTASPLAPELRDDLRAAHDFTVSPTGSHAAWAAPYGEAGDPSLEVVLLPLGPGASPIRMTDNHRDDLRPRFAGTDGRWLIFDSVYAGSEKLPAVEAIRASPLP